jgi:hypothetical protein
VAGDETPNFHPANQTDPAGQNLFPDRLPVARHLDPAAALAFRTPLQEHVLSADGKAAGMLTLLGMMFTVLARLGSPLAEIFGMGGWPRIGCALLLGAFAVLAFGTVVQAFRTISPRFPKVAPSLAFFGDIARLNRDEYVVQMEALSANEALEQMLRYNHTSSIICLSKYRELRRAFRLFEYSFFLWLALVIILATRVLR